MELSKDVFQQVMYAPHKPLVLIVGTPRGQQEVVSDKLHEIAQKWRLRRAAASSGRTDASASAGADARDVVFTWMDAGQWGKWMKDMYGIKVGTEPEIVVADHEVRFCRGCMFVDGIDLWKCSVCCITTRTALDMPSR